MFCLKRGSRRSLFQEWKRTSENQLALELDDASRRQTGEERSVRTGWRRGGLRHLTEVAGVGARSLPRLDRRSEVRVIEDVEEVGPDAQRHSLGDLEVLVHGEIGVEEA